MISDGRVAHPVRSTPWGYMLALSGNDGGRSMSMTRDDAPHEHHEGHAGHDMSTHDGHAGHDMSTHDAHAGHDMSTHDAHAGHDMAGHGSHGGHAGHGDHVGQFRRLFWIMLVFAVP